MEGKVRQLLTGPLISGRKTHLVKTAAFCTAPFQSAQDDLISLLEHRIPFGQDLLPLTDDGSRQRTWGHGNGGQGLPFPRMIFPEDASDELHGHFSGVIVEGGHYVFRIVDHVQLPGSWRDQRPLDQDGKQDDKEYHVV